MSTDAPYDRETLEFKQWLRKQVVDSGYRDVEEGKKTKNQRKRERQKMKKGKQQVQTPTPVKGFKPYRVNKAAQTGFTENSIKD